MSDDYRFLNPGELVKSTDEYDDPGDTWRDAFNWKPVRHDQIGTEAQGPEFPAHAVFRRRKV